MTKSVGTTAFDYKFLKNDCVKKKFGVLGQTLIVLVLEFSTPGSFKNKVETKTKLFLLSINYKMNF
ncbi:hypothetical protein LEP1GSC096_1206 [Leptospira interrogans serovar Hebdomadis str. R499]|nr:hypothetical protein LEP1GSC096_1206 [Leptospira interrogans serovar Hebdomadis str. R499]